MPTKVLNLPERQYVMLKDATVAQQTCLHEVCAYIDTAVVPYSHDTYIQVQFECQHCDAIGTRLFSMKDISWPALAVPF